MRWFDRDVEIEVCVDKRKRRALELNIERWLRFFFGHIFTYPFTPQQREMIEAIRLAIEIGGDQAIAASRGEGKTTIAECVAIFCVLTGLVKFIVLFAATGPDATDSLSTIKSHLGSGGITDIVGGAIILVPFFGLLAPGSRDLDASSVVIEVPPATAPANAPAAAGKH